MCFDSKIIDVYKFNDDEKKNWVDPTASIKIPVLAQ